jgi:uncharacterized membrane protein YcaP (DUF421 family)
MALYAIMRAAFGYLFLILVLRVIGRRPGKQLSPFDYVMVFFLGGLTLSGVVGDEMSMTNAIFQIATIALVHCALAWLRSRFNVAARIIDGTPLILMFAGRWHTDTLSRMRMQDDDVMDSARAVGTRALSGIRMAVLEPVGEITVLPAENEGD